MSRVLLRIARETPDWWRPIKSSPQRLWTIKTLSAPRPYRVNQYLVNGDASSSLQAKSYNLPSGILCPHPLQYDRWGLIICTISIRLYLLRLSTPCYKLRLVSAKRSWPGFDTTRFHPSAGALRKAETHYTTEIFENLQGIAVHVL